MNDIVLNPQPLNHVFTLNEVINIFGKELISSMLIANVLFFVLALMVHQYSLTYWDLPLWSKLDKTNHRQLIEKSISSFALICMPISLGFSVMMITYLYGWNI
jgi:hypothetical protein